METIRKWIRNRRIRRLSERILVHQTLFSGDGFRRGIVEDAIGTARVFYETWERKRKIK